MNNPINILMSLAGGNPQNLLQSFMSGKFNNNPMFIQAQKMLQGKSQQEQIQLVKNTAQSMGVDYNQFMNQLANFGIKLS